MKYFLIFYLLTVNIFSLYLMYNDKSRAIRHQWRIPEKVLFIAAAIGGSLGSICGMYIFRHKTKQSAFVFGMTLLLICHLILMIPIASLL